MSESLEKILKILKEEELISASVEEINPDNGLSTLGLNSISFIKFVVAVEREYGIEFDDQYLDMESIKTFGNLVEYIDSTIASGKVIPHEI